jgi:phosphatidylinositol alpha-mannosyltransferase
MRIALVSPYSWTYPGGVNRHVEALANELLRSGHDANVLAPWDPPDRTSKLLHRSSPSAVEPPEHLIGLGRTVGWPANGGAANMAVLPQNISRLRTALREGDYDLVHVHSPIGFFVGSDAAMWKHAPVVGTFHQYSRKRLPHVVGNASGAWRAFNQLNARIAVSEATAWTCRRFFGGRYRIIPNGVDIQAAPAGPKPESDDYRIVFVGRAEARKGIHVLLAAFEALAREVPARLTIVGAEPEEIRPLLGDPALEQRIDAVGPIPHDERFWRYVHEADVLCAPSLPKESFGMVLIEAFAAGTPVVATEVPGYSELVEDGVNGLLVPAADPQRLAEELHTMYLQPERRMAMGEAARRSAERYDWPNVAAEVEEVYRHTLEAPRLEIPHERALHRVGIANSDGRVRWPGERLASIEPELPAAAGGRRRVARKVALGVVGLVGVGLTALAATRIGVEDVLHSAVRSDLTWVLFAVAIMVASMMLRAWAWHAIVRSALPGRQVRRRDVTSATMIGVLMSATLPARLGEPARAMVLSRHIGRLRETFPVLLGTLVSQTVLNIVALVALGGIIVASTDLFHRNTEKLFLVSLVPLALLVAVVLAPSVMRGRGSSRLARIVNAIRSALVQVRSGLHVFRDPRRGPVAAGVQLGAWALQLLACYALLEAMSLEWAGIGAAAAVLFAVNVTAVIPATPSNIGVFQLATISVLTTGFGVSAADALAYGVILQAVEIATSLGLGLPALVREGMTWSDLRLQALGAAPVQLRSGNAPAID